MGNWRPAGLLEQTEPQRPLSARHSAPRNTRFRSPMIRPAAWRRTQAPTQVVLLLLILSVYFPVYSVVYGFSDDYLWLLRVSANWGEWRSYWFKYWADGRPVQFVNLLLLRLAGGE